MSIRLSSKNDANDFKQRIKFLKDEMQTRYDTCEELYNNITNISNSMLGMISTTARLVETASYNTNNSVNKTGIVGLFSKAIDFTEDYLPTINTDRYGDILDSTCTARHDVYGVEMNSTIAQSAIMYGNVKNAICTVNQQVGENLFKINTMTKESNVIDLSNNTYWSQEIISQNKFLPQKTQHGFDLKEGGAFCELKISLESIRRINSFIFKPLCKYPIQLCYIQYTQTDNRFEERMDFEGNSDIPKDGETIYVSNNGISFNFDTVICKNIFVGFVQTHYERCILPIEYFKIETDRIPPLEEVKNNIKIMPGYKYEYSIANVNAEYKDFAGIGIFETREIGSISTLNKIYLEEQSVHPLIPEEGNEICTDNEYYISTISSPEFKDWIPIFPINKHIVDSERLLDLGGICMLRFLTNNIIKVKCNGKEMQSYEYTPRDDGENIYAITIPNFNPNLIYTISYEPIPSSKVIDLGNEEKTPTKNAEVIYCDESNSYVLKDYPHYPIGNNVEVEVLDTIKNRIYKQLEGKITNTTGTEQFVFNKNKFQYYIDENRIFFNQNMDPRFIVKIKYLTLSSRYKLKIILRRNTLKNREVTQKIKRINIITENM